MLRVQGLVKLFRNMPQMANPKWHAVEENAERIAESKFRPVYPASVKLTSEVIQHTLEENLPALLPTVEEWFLAGFAEPAKAVAAARGISGDSSSSQRAGGEGGSPADCV